MTYRNQLTAAMDLLASDPQTRFVGYGLKAGRAMGTLANVPEAQMVEMPVAEGLMTSAAIGMALCGFKPVVYFERCDFVTNAMDAIVNHLDKIKVISRGEFAPACILRVTVGNSLKPNFTGPTHTQNLAEGIAHMVGFPVVELLAAATVLPAYEAAIDGVGHGRSMMLVEFKDLL